jgi:AtzE family amidohydrolase
MNPQISDARDLANAIRSGEISAKAVVNVTLEKIAQQQPILNCFTTVMAEEAIATANQIDNAIAQGENPGLLAGVPFAVKDLFDIAGITTLAGSKINRSNPPASSDATAVARLKQAGAILVGALNMDEYAYGFVTENTHYGPTRNPHDTTRIAGGSSGGSAASVAAALVPFALGTDTNGSIRVPAAFCGIYGLKPTYGRLSRAGTCLLSASLDCIGPMARSLRDIATIFDLLQGSDTRDPIVSQHPPHYCLPELDVGADNVSMAVAEGYFCEGAEPEALEAVETVAQALRVRKRVIIPETHRARAAAAIITAAEGSNLHLKDLRSRSQDFDPATRERFLAGALMPASWYVQSQRFRSWYRDRIREIFEKVDILLAPTTPCVAPPIGQEKMFIAGEEIVIRPNLGRFTQPLSFVGLPILSFPITLSGRLPLGVQIIAAPYQESLILRVAAELEKRLDSPPK